MQHIQCVYMKLSHKVCKLYFCNCYFNKQKLVSIKGSGINSIHFNDHTAKMVEVVCH